VVVTAPAKPILKDNSAPDTPVGPSTANQELPTSEHIRVPSEFVQFIEPDLVAEGEIVGPQSAAPQPQTTTAKESSSSSSSSGSRRVRMRSTAGDSLQNLS
jgi:hypothetical protein